MTLATLEHKASPPPIQTQEEKERLRSLYRTNILDTPPEREFENIVELCSEICDTPLAMISFIDRDPQWNKAKVGTEMKESPRDISFCTYCIKSDEEVFEIRDAREHFLFSENPFVKKDPLIRFYAGAPMIDSQGNALGCVCVVDHRPRKLGAKERFFLKTMADQVVRELESRADHEELLKSKREMENSIDYAKGIQDALFKPIELHAPRAPEHFTFLRSVDEVSGDFFWAREHEGYFYMAAMDCTGHGVPGGFLSMLGVSFLNEIFNENGALPPGEILTLMRERLVQELKGYDPLTGARDGMDASMVQIAMDDLSSGSSSKTEVQFAGAQNPLYVIRKGIVDEGPSDPYAFLPDRIRPFKDSRNGIEVKGDRTPVAYNEFNSENFQTITLELQKGDMLYLFSDGFADQFGGPRGKKLQYGAFKRLLTQIHKDPLEKQKVRLEGALESWKNESEQEPTDDVLVLGVRL
ncbi:MAG: GAF domain-containing SpoIIE family protein phosphatase [Flavobacteriales bacterium]